jgi:hypothetical protein
MGVALSEAVLKAVAQEQVTRAINLEHAALVIVVRRNLPKFD